MDLINLCLFINAWNLIYIFLNFFYKYNISKNIMHFIHALLFVTYYNNANNNLIYLSLSFYIYDLIYILVNDYSQYAYIIHHIIAIYGLYLSYNNVMTNMIFEIYYVLEISNFMIYITYHIIKTRSNKFLHIIVEFFQFIWYSYFRVIIFTNIIYININLIIEKSNIYGYIGLILLYIMGILWSIKLIKKNIKNINNYYNGHIN